MAATECARLKTRCARRALRALLVLPLGIPYKADDHPITPTGCFEPSTCLQLFGRIAAEQGRAVFRSLLKKIFGTRQFNPKLQGCWEAPSV